MKKETMLSLVMVMVLGIAAAAIAAYDIQGQKKTPTATANGSVSVNILPDPNADGGLDALDQEAPEGSGLPDDGDDAAEATVDEAAVAEDEPAPASNAEKPYGKPCVKDNLEA